MEQLSVSLRCKKRVRRLGRRLAAVAAGVMVLFVATAPAHAQETTTYTYDALGRVTGVSRSGGPANGTTTTYAFDQASNRTNVTVSNSPNGSGSGDSGSGANVQATRYVVVPLNGYTLIKITR